MSIQPHTQEASGEFPTARKRVDPSRYIVPLIGIPLLYGLIRHLPPEALFVAVLVSAWLTLPELYRLHFQHDSVRTETVLGGVALALLLGNLQWPGRLPWPAVLIGLLGLSLAYGLLRRRALERILADTAVLVFGVLYVGLTLGHLLLLRGLDQGVYLIFFVIAVTWAGDTGAYFVGRTLGRTKLAPILSPNKTIEGLAGGLGLSLAAAVLARAWFLPALTYGDCAVLAVLLTGAGVAGDLTESAMKRGAGVKDSGRLLAGHGGLLDRLDSLLFTAPAFYYYVVLMKG